MLFYQSETHDPYFNIAAEEYFLRQFNENLFFLYINRPSLIVGKHQNTMAEINVPYVMEHNIPVVRRLSGGGTVFHDLGNLNYGFIMAGAEGHLVDFTKYSQPILDTLKTLDVTASLRGKSDLVINDLKFSGNAEHIYRNKVLHHGTLLFKSELGTLNQALKADWNKFSDKAVRSNRSQVTNIWDHLPNKISLMAFSTLLSQTALENYGFRAYHLTETDKERIQSLVESKYNTWDWNFAYSPQYRFSQGTESAWGRIEVEFNVEKGLIQQFSFSDNPELNSHWLILCETLIGKPHRYDILSNALLVLNNKELERCLLNLLF